MHTYPLACKSQGAAQPQAGVEQLQRASRHAPCMLPARHVVQRQIGTAIPWPAVGSKCISASARFKRCPTTMPDSEHATVSMLAVNALDSHAMQLAIVFGPAPLCTLCDVVLDKSFFLSLTLIIVLPAISRTKLPYRNGVLHLAGTSEVRGSAYLQVHGHKYAQLTWMHDSSSTQQSTKLRGQAQHMSCDFCAPNLTLDMHLGKTNPHHGRNAISKSIPSSSEKFCQCQLLSNIQLRLKGLLAWHWLAQ